MRGWIIVFLFLSIALNSLESQERIWLKDNAEWYYTVIADMGRYTEYVLLSNVRDTIKLGKDCRVMDVEYSSPWVGLDNYPNNIITYEEGDVLYYYVRGNFYPLYDFSKEVGDTIKVVVETSSFSNDSIAYLIVAEKGTFVINDDTLRTQFLNVADIENISNSAGDTFFGWAIEGIGNTRSFLPMHQYGLSCDAACPVELRCYSDDNINLKLVDYSCDSTYMYTNTLDIHKNDNTLKVSPNPLGPSNHLKLDLGNEYIGQNFVFEIWSINGTIQRTGKSTFGNKIIVNSLIPGIYFIKVFINDQAYVNKLIIQ